MFLATPNQVQNETQTHSILFFYTLYLQRTMSTSFFAGPQHANTEQSALLPFRKWSPSTGVSLGWQGPRSGLAATYWRTITDGGGLGESVHSNSASVSVRQQFTRSLSGGLGANYSINSVLDPSISSNSGGHTISGNATLQRCRTTLQRGDRIYSIAPELRQHSGNLQCSRSKSGFSISLLSISETARKVSMVEDFEDKPAESLYLEQYWSLARRRYWYFLGPLLAGWLVVWGASWFLPSVYKSKHWILVEQPSMPKDYVTPNVAYDLQERLQSITQQILAVPGCYIIDALNLYPNERGRTKLPITSSSGCGKTSLSSWCMTKTIARSLRSLFRTCPAIRTLPNGSPVS